MVKANKTKAMPTHKRMKLDRKIRKNRRKIRREIRRMASSGKLRKRDPNSLRQELKIPNMYPFKKNLLAQLSRRKNQQKVAKKLMQKNKAEEQKALLEAAVKANEQLATGMDIESGPSKRSDKNNLKVKSGMLNWTGIKDISQGMEQVQKNPKTKSYNKFLKRVFQTADILLEVLDARDPQGCRSLDLEREFVAKYPEKRLILVLNKIDMVPVEAVLKWKKILSDEYPTIPFKANLQNQNRNLGSGKVFGRSFEQRPELVQEMVKSAKAVGPDSLLQLIKNYSRFEGSKAKTAVTVGVIGMPNVGKSSIINSLLRRKAAGVSANPGHTKILKEVELDSMVTIIDSPGVIVTNEDETTLLLRNVIKAEQVVDLRKAVDVILTRIDKEQLLRFYKIADFYDTTGFLVQVGTTKGKFKKGGIVDMDLAARIVVQDWNGGRLKYYVQPPEIVNRGSAVRVVAVHAAPQEETEANKGMELELE